MKKYSVFVAFFISLIGFSQNYKGTLDTIVQNGLHKIMLTSEIRSATSENFNFIRIIDAKNNEVPYVLMHSGDRTFSKFKSIEILTKSVIKDSITSIIIENKTGKIQESITLKIANTTIHKNYTIYGSNNKIDWFGLVANKRLTNLNSNKKTGVEKTISFPLHTYKFLRINFNDKNSLPINILDVGAYESKFFTQTPITINHFKQEVIEVKDRKVTQIKFTSNNSHKINTISFNINTQFFQRNVSVFVKKTRKVKKRIETYNEVIARFQLSSKNQNTFVLTNLNEKEFTIEIDNQDNPSLAIERILLFQKPVYIVAILNPKESYKLITNNTLKKPSYDLGNFISDKTNTINEVLVTNFTKVEKEKEIKTDTSFWQTSTFMWCCIVLGGIIVFYVAFGVLKDLKNQES